jgi:hypothetical protein
MQARMHTCVCTHTEHCDLKNVLDSFLERKVGYKGGVYQLYLLGLFPLSQHTTALSTVYTIQLKQTGLSMYITQWRHMKEQGYSWSALNISTRCSWQDSLMPQPFATLKTIPSTHRVGWLGHKASLGNLWKSKIFRHAQNQIMIPWSRSL